MDCVPQKTCPGGRVALYSSKHITVLKVGGGTGKEMRGDVVVGRIEIGSLC